jgi:hypothetical protein
MAERYAHHANELPFAWVALIVLAIFLSCFALWRAYVWVRNRLALRREASPNDSAPTKDPWDEAVSRPPGDRNPTPLLGESDLGRLGGMTQREQEILFSTYAPRKVRKEMRQRLREREQRERGG